MAKTLITSIVDLLPALTFEDAWWAIDRVGYLQGDLGFLAGFTRRSFWYT